MAHIFFIRLRCAVFYDETFKAMNGGSTSASETRIRSIFNHVENLYSILTVNGQARSIVPEIVDVDVPEIVLAICSDVMLKTI